MVSVITGDIINSKKNKPEIWLPVLKEELLKAGLYPEYWEVYRGDSFQLLIENPSETLLVAIKLKAALRAAKQDVRLAVGIGEISYKAPNILESNGTAFVYSGEKFELLKKEKRNLALKSSRSSFDDEMNLLLRLSLIAMDKWTVNDAEIVKIALENPSLSQEELGKRVGIKQNAVSGRLKRACYEEIVALNERFKEQLKALL